MKKKRIHTIAVVFVILFLCALLIKAEYENHIKQEALNQVCRSMLSKVDFVYDYESLSDAEIRAYQAEDISNLYQADFIINYTSWPQKDKIHEMLLILYQYYTRICYNNDVIEASKASAIYELYLGAYVNISNDYCEQYINNLINFIKEELKNVT